MERLNAEFLEICADWAELRRAEVLCSRTGMGTWQAVVLMRDAAGIFLSPPVLAAEDKRKNELPTARRERIFSLLAKAAAAGRSRRIEEIAGRKPAAAKVR